VNAKVLAEYEAAVTAAADSRAAAEEERKVDSEETKKGGNGGVAKGEEEEKTDELRELRAAQEDVDDEYRDLEERLAELERALMMKEEALHQVVEDSRSAARYCEQTGSVTFSFSEDNKTQLADLGLHADSLTRSGGANGERKHRSSS
jgi:Mg2+ and Co2+ transporter CorA